jgi:DNA-binding NarL/FixJ family response regulator
LLGRLPEAPAGKNAPPTPEKPRQNRRQLKYCLWGKDGRAVVGGGGLVLVVDDDDGFRALVSEILHRGGLRTREASTGEEALEAARKERPSFVLLDVSLPGMSGYDVCRELRAEFGERLPIVFVSGARTEPFDRVAGLRLGADDYIVKGFDPSELLARVDRFVGRAHEAPTSPFRLTKRELEVLGHLVRGFTPKETARELAISRKTVATHIQNILTKLDVHSQAQAVAVALQSSLFDLISRDDRSSMLAALAPRRPSH